MKTFPAVAAFLLLPIAAALAAPRDPINPRDIKEKVSLKPGTKGTIQFKQQGDALTAPKLTKAADEKATVVEVEFKKEPQMMMLTVRNGFAKDLRYRAAVRYKGRREYIETSIIPVLAGLSSFESWPDPIDEIILFDFKLSDETQ